MQVSFSVTGGLPPVFRGCELDTEALPRAEAELLDELVGASRLLTGHVTPHIVGRDTLKYAFKIDRDGTQLRNRFDEMQVWPELSPLIEFLERYVRDLPDND
jgi:hypothetical protein